MNETKYIGDGWNKVISFEGIVETVGRFFLSAFMPGVLMKVGMLMIMMT